ncbi:helix-turn-helix domain-containing protein [Streptomyces sp. NPDC048506]|uniref:AraC-like ligand-binding domain-containing protein n=1 Tax=Streptomyces sp. NPDC048506 TaxID=3155028 RepID=UPI003436155F
MLIETELCTEGVAAEDRFDHWREHLSTSYVPVEVLSDRAADFPASQRMLQLGAVRLWQTEHPRMTLRRTPKLIRRSDPEMYHLSLALRGAKTLTLSDRSADCTAQDLILVDTARPYSMAARTGPDEERVLGTGLFVPRSLLPLPATSADRLIGRRMSGRDGLGGLLAHFLTRIWADIYAYDPADGPRLGTVAIDLLSSLLAHTLDSEHALEPETHRRSLLLRIKAFIHQHLPDPRLTPRTVAAAHHISLSYLHRLFQHEETTVAAWIRLQRLERARHDLADTAWHSTPIHAIASRWGFPRAADFTRAFHAVYGMPPRDYRNHACRPAL